MYVVTGATGNTGSVVAKTLLAKGQSVRAIGRNADHLKELSAKGAEPFICDVSDRDALTRAFTGARAVYALLPPDVTSTDYRAHQDQVTDSIVNALEKAGIKHAVCLSSFGADKPDKTGPVAGLHYLEERLKKIANLNAVYLRAGYFMENTLAQIGVVKQMGIAAGPLRPDLKIPMIATRDIGAVAADELLKLDFHGHQTRELLGQRDITMTEVATIVGKDIDKADLQYVQAPHSQIRAAMIGMGMSASFVDLILEMSAALNSGHMRALEPRSPRNTTPTSFETFVKEVFVPRYFGKSAAA